jgi:membrane protein
LAKPVINFVRHTLLPSKPARLIIQTVLKWQKDKCLEMGAALAYYALFSLFPILLVLLSVLGFLLGPDTDVFGQILAFVEASLPPEAVTTVEETLLQLNDRSVGAGVVGFVLVFFTASGVFGALNRSIDQIWKAEEPAQRGGSLQSTAMSFVVKKLFAFGLVLSTAALLLLTLLANIVIRVVLQVVQQLNNSIAFLQLDNLLIAKALQIGSSVFLLSLTMLLLLRFLPSTSTPWKDIWPGALLTAALLLGLQQLVSNSVIQIGGQYQSYGVIGGVMILLLWIYFTCQIFFLGCEFAYVYAHLFGSRRHQAMEL